MPLDPIIDSLHGAAVDLLESQKQQCVAQQLSTCSVIASSAKETPFAEDILRLSQVSRVLKLFLLVKGFASFSDLKLHSVF